MFRLGIIGSGWMGRTYTEAIQLNTGVKLAAIAGGSRAEALPQTSTPNSCPPSTSSSKATRSTAC